MAFRLIWMFLGSAYVLATWCGAGENGGGRSPENPDSDSAKVISLLIRQLGDDQFAMRDEAEKKLKTFGLQARMALKDACRSSDPEVRVRAKRVLELVQIKIEEQVWMKAVEGVWPEALAKGHLAGPILGVMDAASRSGGRVSKEAALGVAGDGNATGQWLVETQAADGHWDSRRFGAQARDDVGQTGLVLLSILGSGHTEKVGRYKHVVQGAVEWLRKRQREDGSIRPKGWERVDGVSHAWAGLALGEAAGMADRPETRKAAQKAVDFSMERLMGERNGKKFGFCRLDTKKAPDLFTTCIVVLQLKSAKVAGLRVSSEAIEGAIAFLDAVDQKTNNEFSYVPGGQVSLQATMMGAVTRTMLGGTPGDLEPYTRKALKAYKGPSTGQPNSDILSNYFGTILAFQQGGELWKVWKERLQKSLVEEQEQKGRAKGSWRPSGNWAEAGRVLSTAVNSLCLQVNYRFLPMYK